jgi:hypothetical protein
LSVKEGNATNQTQKQDLISPFNQQQPSSTQSQQNQQTPQLYPPLSQQQPPQQQLPPLNQFQPQPPVQQQQGTFPQTMRPVLLDNLKMSPNVLATLDLQKKLNLVSMAYNYCGNPPGGILPGQDGENCRQFMSQLDHALVNMLSSPMATQQQNFQNTPDFTKEDEEVAAFTMLSCVVQSTVDFQNIPSATKPQCD